jgi:hypothetical protein
LWGRKYTNNAKLSSDLLSESTVKQDKRAFYCIQNLDRALLSHQGFISDSDAFFSAPKLQPSLVLWPSWGAFSTLEIRIMVNKERDCTKRAGVRNPCVSFAEIGE